MAARVDAEAMVVRVEGRAIPFDLDLSAGAVILEPGASELRLRTVTWAEKWALARFAHVGPDFIRNQFLNLVTDRRTPVEPALRDAAATLAMWLNAPAGEAALPLDPGVLAQAAVGVCRAMALRPVDLDRRPAAEVELLWRTVHSGGDPTSFETPGPEDGTVRIQVVPNEHRPSDPSAPSDGSAIGQNAGTMPGADSAARQHEANDPAKFPAPSERTSALGLARTNGNRPAPSGRTGRPRDAGVRLPPSAFHEPTPPPAAFAGAQHQPAAAAVAEPAPSGSEPGNAAAETSPSGQIIKTAGDDRQRSSAAFAPSIHADAHAPEAANRPPRDTARFRVVAPARPAAPVQADRFEQPSSSGALTEALAIGSIGGQGRDAPLLQPARSLASRSAGLSAGDEVMSRMGITALPALSPSPDSNQLSHPAIDQQVAGLIQPLLARAPAPVAAAAPAGEAWLDEFTERLEEAAGRLGIDLVG